MNAIVSPNFVSSQPRASEADIALSRSLKHAWKAYIEENHATAAQHATYALLRGKSLDKTFTPLRRPGKIQAAGGVADQARQFAEASARRHSLAAFAPFASLLEGAPVKSGRYQDPSAHPLLSRVPE